MRQELQEFIDRLKAAEAWMPTLSAASTQRIEEQRKRSAKMIEAAHEPNRRSTAQKQAAIEMLQAMEREYRPLVGGYYPWTIQILARTSAELFGAEDAVNAEAAWFIVHHLAAKLNGTADTESRARIRAAWLEKMISQKSGMTISNINSKFGGPTHRSLNDWCAGKSHRRTKDLREKLASKFGCNISEVPL